MRRSRPCGIAFSVAGMARDGTVAPPSQARAPACNGICSSSSSRQRAPSRAGRHAPASREAAAIVSRAWPRSSTTTGSNGLPINRIALPGTRALTVLVAFDAGARNERPQENGMAHFLEHLVFKGGEKYPTYSDVNETAERLGGVLNAYTSHDLVAFHITVRAESAPAAIDLLSDFVGRPEARRRGARPRARRRDPGDQRAPTTSPRWSPST